jgi:hypothetical protein
MMTDPQLAASDFLPQKIEIGGLSWPKSTTPQPIQFSRCL